MEGKTAIVTGAANGIGASVAKLLARSGRSVVIIDRDENALSETLNSIQGAGFAAHSICADLSDLSVPTRIFEEAHHVFGGVEELVNVAGTVDYGSLQTYSADRLRSLLAIHVEANYSMIQAYVRASSDRRLHPKAGGSVVNVGTMHALRGVSKTSAYAAAKGALHAMTRSLAIELAPLNIRLNTLALGATETERLRNDMPPDLLAQRLKQIPLRRLATQEEAAGAALFLLDNEYITGTDLIVDGGFTAFGDQ